MCQPFSGHKVKQLSGAFRSPLAINNYWQNEGVHDYKIPRYIQTYLASLRPWFDNSDDEPVLFSRYEKNFPKRVESTEGNLPLQLLTEPYVNLSIHKASDGGFARCARTI